MRTILEATLNSLNKVSIGDQRGPGPVGHNCERYFIGLFHVSEQLGHLKKL
jgi:hypothetical protein